MAISTQTSSIQYLGNGSLTDFTVPFLFNSNTDLAVISTVITTGVATVNALTVDYNVTGAGVGSGTVSFIVAPATGIRLTIYRKSPPIHTTVYGATGSFPTKAVESDFDYAAMTQQEINHTITKCFQIPIDDPDGLTLNIPPAAQRANKVLTFDGAGNVSATVDGGFYRGSWLANTDYRFRDLFSDPMTGDIYFVLIAYTSTTIAADTASGYTDLLFSPANYAVGNPFNIAQYCLTTGSSNAYVITGLTNFTYMASGAALTFKANFTNTGATTLNVNGLGAVPIVGITQAALTGGEIQSTSVYYVVYDGTSFNLLNPSKGASTIFNAGLTSSDQSSSWESPANPGFNTSSTYTATTPFFSYQDGALVTFVADFPSAGDGSVNYVTGSHATSSAITLNVNSLGAKSIKANIPSVSGIGSLSQDIGGNCLLPSYRYLVQYNLADDCFYLLSSSLNHTAPIWLTATFDSSQSVGAVGKIVSGEYYTNYQGFFNGTNFIIPRDGRYLVTATVGFNSSTTLSISSDAGLPLADIGPGYTGSTGTQTSVTAIILARAGNSYSIRSALARSVVGPSAGFATAYLQVHELR